MAGIDGTVSTAIGAALSADDRRTVAFMGDLTFVHDATGLLIGPAEPRPRDLTIVVANDDGGGIFALLEQGERRFSGAEYDGAYERVFGTPHRTDLAAVCAGFSVPHRKVSVADLPSALAADSDGGVRVIEVSTDRDRLRDLHAAIGAGL